MSLADTIPTGRHTETARPGSRATAAVVIAAPVLVLTSELVAPREPADQSAAADAAFLLDHASRFAVSWGVGLLAAAALAAAYLLVVRRLDGRGRMPARVAAVLGVVGAVGLAGHMAVSLAVRDILLADSSAAAAAEDAFSGLSAILTVVPVIVGLNLAVLLLSIAMFRAGWAGWWVIVPGALALVADFGPTTYNTIVHAAFALVVFAVAACRVAAEG